MSENRLDELKKEMSANEARETRNGRWKFRLGKNRWGFWLLAGGFGLWAVTQYIILPLIRGK